MKAACETTRGRVHGCVDTGDTGRRTAVLAGGTGGGVRGQWDSEKLQKLRAELGRSWPLWWQQPGGTQPSATPAIPSFTTQNLSQRNEAATEAVPSVQGPGPQQQLGVLLEMQVHRPQPR